MRAFLGRITPEMSAVGLTVDYEEKKIMLHVFTTIKLSPDIAEEVSCAETEVMSDFSPDFTIDTSVHISPTGDTKLIPGGTLHLIFEMRNQATY